MSGLPAAGTWNKRHFKYDYTKNICLRNNLDKGLQEDMQTWVVPLIKHPYLDKHWQINAWKQPQSQSQNGNQVILGNLHKVSLLKYERLY